MPKKELCFRCIEADECELYQKWEEMAVLWSQANEKLSENRDSSKDETEEIIALEEKKRIASEYLIFRNGVKQEAIERGCKTVLQKMG